MGRRSFWGISAVAVAFVATAGASLALDEGKDEKDRLKACEASLCQLVAKKGGTTGDFTCSLQKTWAKDKIVEGARASQVSWSFGDARCKVDLKLPQAEVLAALGPGQQTLQFPEHTINCEIERDKEITPVTVKLSPKIAFKDGQSPNRLDKPWPGGRTFGGQGRGDDGRQDSGWHRPVPQGHDQGHQRSDRQQMREAGRGQVTSISRIGRPGKVAPTAIEKSQFVSRSHPGSHAARIQRHRCRWHCMTGLALSCGGLVLSLLPCPAPMRAPAMREGASVVG